MFDSFRAIFVLLIIGVVVIGFSFVALPELLQIPRTYNGEVTSTNTQNYGVQETNVNFKDGSSVALWGIYNISIGNHTLHTTTGWMGVENLRQIDGENV